MIAMQYSFTLPADYDMAIVDRRIAEKGPLLDGFPGLAFKAYLTARHHHLPDGSPLPEGLVGPEVAAENLYAPFYLWRRTEGMNDFVCGPGFAGVSGAFGWPVIRHWVPWEAALGRDVASARYAVREEAPIAPHTRLDLLRSQESAAARQAVSDGTLAAVAAYDPAGWSLVRFRLLAQLPEEPLPAGARLYGVGHVSLAAAGD